MSNKAVDELEEKLIELIDSTRVDVGGLTLCQVIGVIEIVKIKVINEELE